MTVGQKIKKYIEDKDIPQTTLSIEAHIPLPKLNLALNGKRRLALEEYEILCGVLKVPVDTFLIPRLPNRKES